MYRYVAFDVETPNRYNNRMSAIGISVIEGGVIVDEFFSYVNPETYFERFNTMLTGIDSSTVKGAPTFDVLWERIKPIMDSGILVAHNASFDLRVLKSCLCDYGITWKDSVKYCCTARMGRTLLPDMHHKLNDLCGYYGICLDHHKADSDSHACAEILLHYFTDGADERQFIRTYKLD